MAAADAVRHVAGSWDADRVRSTARAGRVPNGAVPNGLAPNGSAPNGSAPNGCAPPAREPVLRVMAGGQPVGAAPREPVLRDPAEAAVDAALVRRTRDGDREAFGQLVRRHLTAALSAARAVLGDVPDVEDVCQDAFMTALQRLDDCRPEEKFRGWLLVTVRNRAIDLQRRQKVRSAETLDAEPGTAEAGRVAGLASRDATPLRFAERADARAHLAAALATLTDVRRQVVLLHDLEGWSHREIAEHLGLAEGTIRAHLFWARRALRERLSAEWRKESDDE